ncbi:MAG: TIGR03557 family F420-dependent LLM class oxidoreductase [Chloroflexi bacterium]|nr:TIGR03557 family F420-dependent LLM class oxidoreductase [Chloroflexota bacterium]
MVEIGYALSSEEHPPKTLVRNAQKAEELGFSFALISDHYHPWIDAQGHAPFVWSVIGGIAAVTERIRLGTGVTCPIMRIHPAIIAQAAATSAAMLPGRFFLGLGTGEALNEHILGNHWPMAAVRQNMLEEAIDIIRMLWEGTEVNYWGEFFTVENARIYTLPDELPPIYIAASGSGTAGLAAQIGDGLISTSPDEEVVTAFKSNGGDRKPLYGQVTVCWAASEQEAVDTVHRWWPTSAVPGTLKADLPTPAHFEDAVKMVKKDDLRQMALGPDPQSYLEKINEMVECGYEHIYIHQIGPDQDGFFNFYQKELKNRLRF